jgi:hypothetical protein
MARDFLSSQRSRMAARVGVGIVRSGMTFGIMVSRIRRLVIMMVIVIMPAAFDRMVVVVGMIQREHTAEEPGDHAEHQEP